MDERSSSKLKKKDINCLYLFDKSFMLKKHGKTYKEKIFSVI